MKQKVINSILCRKFDKWVETIDDPEVVELVKANTICTGGAIASMLLNEDVNDYDFYFRDAKTTEAVARYYVKKFKDNPPPRFKTAHTNSDGKFECDISVLRSIPDVDLVDLEALKSFVPRIKIVVKSAGIASEKGDKNYQYFEETTGDEAAQYVAQAMDTGESNPLGVPVIPNTEETAAKFRPVFLSANAISLSHKVQLVVRFYGDPATIHENYDFIHATNYWTSWDRKITVNINAMLALMNKDLIYVGSKYPLCSLFRIRKFMNRGWKITAGQMLKISLNLQEYDLLDVGILEEQLTGVDVAYFNELILRIKEKHPDAERIDGAYICELVDKLF